jgi:hypothetical protein
MSGGPIFPCSAFPVTSGNVFPFFYVGAGSGQKYQEGLGVVASLGGDSIWALCFKMPPTTLPSGTCQLNMFAQANATSGAAKVNPKWASVAAGEDPSSATLQAEGTSTLTWAGGGADKYTLLAITLDADTPTAGEMIVMNLTFETSGWTLAATSVWTVSVQWV